MHTNPEPAERTWGRELFTIGRAGLVNFRRRFWVLAVVVLVGVLAIYLQTGQDRVLLQQIHSDSGAIDDAAKAASYWGDWPGWTMLGFLVWAAGAAARKIHWRAAGLAGLLAILMAGITVSCFRPMLGRPRPYTRIADGLYGPGMDTKYHSFMSGHTTAAFATATALTIAAPPVGIPALGGAMVVGWSRLQLDRHNPSDVLVGGATGILWGWCFGRAARRQRGGQTAA